MIFGSEKSEDGHYRSFAALTFDHYKQDEVVTMSYSNENGVLNYGFNIMDRPQIPLTKQIEELKRIQESNLDDETKQKN